MFNDLMDTLGFVAGKDPEVGQAMEKEFKMAYQLFKSPRAPMI